MLPGEIAAVGLFVYLCALMDIHNVLFNPPGLTIVSVTENSPSRPPADIQFSSSSLVASWPSMSLPGDSTRRLTVNVRASNEGSYTTTARVTTSSPETNLNNNADSATVDVQVGGVC